MIWILLIAGLALVILPGSPFWWLACTARTGTCACATPQTPAPHGASRAGCLVSTYASRNFPLLVTK